MTDFDDLDISAEDTIYVLYNVDTERYLRKIKVNHSDRAIYTIHTKRFLDAQPFKTAKDAEEFMRQADYFWSSVDYAREIGYTEDDKREFEEMIVVRLDIECTGYKS